MVYSSIEFLLPLSGPLAAFVLIRGRQARGPAVAASLVFYGWSGLFDLGVFLSVVLVSYASVWIAERLPRWRKPAISLGVAALLAHLVFWKYGGWLHVRASRRRGRAFSARNSAADPSSARHQLLHLHRHRVPARLLSRQGGPDDAARIPPLPLVLRAPDRGAHRARRPAVAAAARSSSPTAEDMAVGLALFSRGLFKKMVVADRLAPLVDAVFASPMKFDRRELVCGAFAAISSCGPISAATRTWAEARRGCSASVPENFLSPLLYRKPSEFWQRWHVTLATWMRDYVGRRCRAGRCARSSPCSWSASGTAPMDVPGLGLRFPRHGDRRAPAGTLEARTPVGTLLPDSLRRGSCFCPSPGCSPHSGSRCFARATWGRSPAYLRRAGRSARGLGRARLVRGVPGPFA